VPRGDPPDPSGDWGAPLVPKHTSRSPHQSTPRVAANECIGSIPHPRGEGCRSRVPDEVRKDIFADSASHRSASLGRYAEAAELAMVAPSQALNSAFNNFCHFPALLKVRSL
jgi:hypothetical protein